MNLSSRMGPLAGKGRGLIVEIFLVQSSWLRQNIVRLNRVSLGKVRPDKFYKMFYAAINLHLFQYFSLMF